MAERSRSKFRLLQELIVRIFSRSRWIYGGAVAAVALGALSVQWLAAQTPGSPPGQSSSAGTSRSLGESQGSEESSGPGQNPERVYSILNRDEVAEAFAARRVFSYSMEPGAAKPKRVATDVDAGGYGAAMSGMGGAYAGMMGGAMGMSGMPPHAATAAEDSKRWPIIYALVGVDPEDGARDAAKPRRARIEVAVGASHGPAAEGAMMGMGGMPGSPGMGMGSSGELGGVLVPFDSQELSLIKHLPGALKTIAPQERANITQLIRLDVWIEDARSALGSQRNDLKAFAATEAQLKKLLSEEYDALLAKQRADAERLRKRLEQLQSDLDRRAQAKDRVVDVQLGKLVLEAQGLLDAQR